MSLNEISDAAVGRVAKLLASALLGLFLTGISYIGATINAHLARQDQLLMEHTALLSSVQVTIDGVAKAQALTSRKIDDIVESQSKEEAEAARIKQELQDRLRTPSSGEPP